MLQPAALAPSGRASNRPWFKFYTRDFRDGVRVLTLEEIGAYTLILSLIYDSGGRIKDDAKTVCAQLGMDVRVWKRVRDRLVSEGKIQASEDGFLANERASQEIASAELLSEKRRTSGKSGGQQSGKSRAKPLSVKEMHEAIASGLLDTEGRGQKAEELSPPDKSEGDSSAPSAPALIEDLPKKAAPKRAKPKPKNAPFVATDETMPAEPNEAMCAYAAKAGLINGTRALEFAKFRQWHIDHMTLVAGVERRWQTWVDKWLEKRPTRAGVVKAANMRPVFLGDGSISHYEKRSNGIRPGG